MNCQWSPQSIRSTQVDLLNQAGRRCLLRMISDESVLFWGKTKALSPSCIEVNWGRSNDNHRYWYALSKAA